MNVNSPFFDRIRIKSGGEPRRAQHPGCDHPGCAEPGLYRAPKGRGQDGQYWQFCLAHVREYNQAYNYFDGMTDDAVVAYQKDAVIGHRPTWSMGVNAAARGRGAGEPQPPRDWDYSDPLGVLRAAGVSGARRPAEPQKPRRPAPILRALETLGLDEHADTPAIKAQYKALVKRFHPDAHGGDRSFEDRLVDIIRAHDTLKNAGLC